MVMEYINCISNHSSLNYKNERNAYHIETNKNAKSKGNNIMKKENNNHRILVVENRLTQEQVSFESKPEYVIWFLKEADEGVFDFYDEYQNYLFTMDSEMQLLGFDEGEVDFLMKAMDCGGIEPEDIPYIECFNVDVETKDSLIYFQQKLDKFSRYAAFQFEDARTRRTDSFTRAFDDKCDTIWEDVFTAFQMTFPDDVPVNPIQHFSFNGIRFNVTIHSLDNQTVLDFDLG